MKDAKIETLNTIINDQLSVWGKYVPTEKELNFFEAVPEVHGFKIKQDVEVKRVAVHNGDFHSDDVFCAAIIKQLFPDVEIVRTRDPGVLETCDLLLDVGEGLLDHHGKRAADRISAATRLLLAIVNTEIESSWDESWIMKTPEQEFIASRAWEIVSQIATWDTGHAEGQNPFIEIHRICAHARATDRDLDEAFNEAVEYMTASLERLEETWSAEACAVETAEKEIAAQKDAAIVVFREKDSRKAPIKEMLYKMAENAMYYVSPESEEDWRILCCCDPAQEFSFFGSRKLIPEKYRGLRGEQLSETAEIPGGIFCHAAGFIAGFKTCEAAEAFAKKCLE